MEMFLCLSEGGKGAGYLECHLYSQGFTLSMELGDISVHPKSLVGLLSWQRKGHPKPHPGGCTNISGPPQSPKMQVRGTSLCSRKLYI